MKRIGLVGCGHIHTPNFVKKLSQRFDIEIPWVWDHKADRAAATAEQLGAKVAECPCTIWNDGSVDSVVICSETNRHEEFVMQAVESKKNMYVEKPLALGAADAWRMAAAIEASGVIFQTGFMARTSVTSRFVREQIKAGAFGKVTRLRMSNCHSGSLGGWFDTEWRWMADPKQAGVGGFGDLGFHSLDAILWMLGTPEKVTATTQVVTGRYGDECDETGEGLLKFADGTIASLAAAWVDVQHPISLIISGTEGHAYVCNGELFFKSNHVEGADGLTPWKDLPPQRPHSFDEFLNAIVGQEAHLITVREAALTSAVMEAMYQGSRESTWVKPVLG